MRFRPQHTQLSGAFCCVRALAQSSYRKRSRSRSPPKASAKAPVLVHLEKRRARDDDDGSSDDDRRNKKQDSAKRPADSDSRRNRELKDRYENRDRK